MVVSFNRSPVLVNKGTYDAEIRAFLAALPKDRITPDINEDFDFPEIGEEHVTHLGLWMKHKAYAKADTDRFNGPLSDKYKADFTDYCALAKAEIERAKHKNREVVYGGI